MKKNEIIVAGLLGGFKLIPLSFIVKSLNIFIVKGGKKMEMSTTFKLSKETYESIEELAKEEGFKSKEELIEDVLHSFALAKMWEYKNEVKEFEQKYGMTLEDFKRKVEKSEKENFEEWDDLIIWEGLDKGYKLWEKKVQRYKKCSKHYSLQRRAG